MSDVSARILMDLGLLKKNPPGAVRESYKSVGKTLIADCDAAGRLMLNAAEVTYDRSD